MNSTAINLFLHLRNESEEKAVALDNSIDKSVQKINEILMKSSQIKPSTTHFSIVEVEIINLRSNKLMCTLERVANISSIGNIKQMLEKKYPQYYTSRQSFRLSQKGKSLKDSDTLTDFNLSNECTLYFKDLGPQIGWSTVFYCEYAGPLFVYLLFYFRAPLVYGAEYTFKPSTLEVVKLAAICHSFHYAKRLLETKFIHRFSHGTMPIKNLLRNCGYYWTFAAWMAYFINHPLYSPPCYGDAQVYLGLVMFIFCELGNLSTHVALKNLRPAGSTKRQIPKPTANPFTWMFSLVSCPNYTYEVGSWIGFAIMTQTLVGFLFATVGFLQMLQWALAKHRNYRREFTDYPRSRKAMIPFIL